jgi:hypothetical protein
MAPVKVSTALADKPKNLLGERGARFINDGWKGDFVADANAAAFQYGLLVSGSMLPQDRAADLLKFHFEFRKVDSSYWSSVYQSFLCGRGLRNKSCRAKGANDSCSSQRQHQG